MSVVKEILETAIENYLIGHPRLTEEQAMNDILQSGNDLTYWKNYRPFDTIDPDIEKMDIQKFKYHKDAIECYDGLKMVYDATNDGSLLLKLFNDTVILYSFDKRRED